MATNREFPVSVVISAQDRASSTITSLTRKVDAASRTMNRTNKDIFELTGIATFQNSFFSAEKTLTRFGKAAFQFGGFDYIANSAWSAARRTGEAFGAITTSFRSMSSVLLGSGLAVGGVGFGAVELFKGFTNDAMSAAWGADRLGMNKKSYQELRFVGEKVGIPHENFDRIMRKFSVNIGEGFQGRGEAYKAFSALGVRLTDRHGKVRDTEGVFSDVAQALSTGKHSASFQNTVLSALFGQRGLAISNMMMLGRGGIRAERDKVQSLHGVIDDDAIKKADQFRSTFVDLKYTLFGLRNIFASEVFPVVNNLAVSFEHYLGSHRKSFQEWTKNFAHDLPQSLERAGHFFGNLKDAANPVVTLFDKLSDKFGAGNLVLGALGLKIGADVVPSIVSLSGALVTLGQSFLLTPIGLFTAALVGGAALVLTHWEEVSSFFKDFFDMFETGYHKVRIMAREPFGMDVSSDYSFLNRDQDVRKDIHIPGNTFLTSRDLSSLRNKNYFSEEEKRKYLPGQQPQMLSSENITKVIIDMNNAPPGARLVSADGNVKLKVNVNPQMGFSSSSLRADPSGSVR